MSSSQLNSILENIGGDASQSIDQIGPHLGNVDLWQDSTYNRVTLLKNQDIEIVAIYWKKGQATPLHGHGQSKCFFTVFQGEIEDSRFSSRGDFPDLKLKLTPKDGMQNEDCFHTLSCVSEKAISLHIYTPPICTETNSTQSKNQK